MTQNEATTSPQKEIPRDDNAFLAELLKNMDEHRQVDLVKVADTLGYGSVAAVGNRFRTLRKKYGLQLFGKQATGKSDTTSASASDSPASTPNTPTKSTTPRKPRPRKGAKATNAPIPATANSPEPNSSATKVAKSKDEQENTNVEATNDRTDVNA